MPAVLRACLQFEFPAPAQRGRVGAPLEKGECLFQGSPGRGCENRVATAFTTNYQHALAHNPIIYGALSFYP